MVLQLLTARIKLINAQLRSEVGVGEPWPVIIAGAGPTGLALSALLSSHSIRSLVLERAPAVTNHPQVLTS